MPPVIQQDLEANLAYIQAALGSPGDLVMRRICLHTRPGETVAACVYLDGLVDEVAVNDQILRPLMSLEAILPADKLPGWAASRALSLGQVQLVSGLDPLIEGVLAGKTAVLFAGAGEALVAGTRGWEERSIQEPPSDILLRGSREGFTESLTVNTSLLRRRLRTAKLRLDFLVLGRESRTQVVVAYLEGIANPRVVDEVKSRLARIDTDAVISDAYVEEMIRDAPLSPFPTVANSERPDAVAAGLLEGQVALLVEGSPFALRVPAFFLQFFQSPEDYYLNFQAGTFSRWLRLVGLLVALVLPSLYVAITTFHPQMIPTPLLITMAGAREGTPFPTVVETLIMEGAFEVLREAGLRLTPALGPVVSIVGALILGQAAIDAGVVSATTVVVVAGAAITSLMFTRPEITPLSRLVRFPVLIAAGFLGLIGVIAALVAMHLHILSLRSFGVPYLFPLAPSARVALGDTLVRRPAWGARYRPTILTRRRSVRDRSSMPRPPQK